MAKSKKTSVKKLSRSASNSLESIWNKLVWNQYILSEEERIEISQLTSLISDILEENYVNTVTKYERPVSSKRKSSK